MSKGKNLMALFIVFSLVLSTNLYSKEKRGAIVEIYKIRPKMEGTPFEKPDIKRGELHSVKENSLLLINPVSWATTTIEIADIDFIKIVREAKPEWFIWGSLIGGSGGAIIGLSTKDRDDLRRDWFPFYPVAIGLGIGALIGGGYGVLVGVNKTIQISGKSPEEIKEILEELSKNAIVKDYQ